MSRIQLSSEEKALQLNLQPSIYGVFAEIGAGQEVVNHFYRAGAASGTVAKSISAYDMSVSDSLYGRTNGYVSKERLESMLSIEYQSLVVNLSSKAPVAHFFAFANTIELTGYNKENSARGWIGIKYQSAPNLRPKSCKIHVIFHTKDIDQQRKMIGNLGVNLVHGVYEHKNDPNAFLSGLSDNLNNKYFEINFIECSKDAFPGYDNKMLSFLLVEHNLTRMIMIDSDGEIRQPFATIRKKDLMIIRGRFRPPTKVTIEMFKKSLKEMVNNLGFKSYNVFQAAEITFRCYREDKDITLNDYVQRTELLTELNIPVIVTNFRYHSELIHYFNKFCQLNSINLVLGTDNLMKVFYNPGAQETGGAMDFIQQLSRSNGRVFLFPQKTKDGILIGLDKLMVDHRNKKLLEYMQECELIHEVGGVDVKLLNIRSTNVLSNIRNGTDGWQTMVPYKILQPLISKKMFSDASGII